MKLVFPRIFFWIGLIVVFFSLVFEILREPIDFNKGLFSINTGLILIFLSIKNRKSLSFKKEDIFFWSFFLISIFLFIIPNHILYSELYFTIIIAFPIIIYNITLFLNKR